MGHVIPVDTLAPDKAARSLGSAWLGRWGLESPRRGTENMGRGDISPPQPLMQQATVQRFSFLQRSSNRGFGKGSLPDFLPN